MAVPDRRKIALVTGANTAFGKAIGQALEAAGLTVISHNSEPDGDGNGLNADLMDQASVADMMETIDLQYGGLDVLVAAHPEPAPVDLLKDSSAAFWWQINSMLTTSFIVVQAAVTLLAKSKQGRVVLLSSGWSAGGKKLSGLAAASAGIDVLTTTLARELGPLGITVNSIAPALIDGEAWLACDAAGLGLSEAELRKQAGQIVPTGSLGTCDALARLVTLLCQPALGAATGQAVQCSGGYFRHRI